MRVLPAAFLATAMLCWQSSWATAQVPDQIIVDGERLMLFSEPLHELLGHFMEQGKLGPNHQPGRCTASWRDYVATWELRGDQLFLVSIHLNPCGPALTDVSLARLFPGAAIPVAASWYTGNLVVPQGSRVNYVHMGYESQYERYLVIKVNAGRAVGRDVVTERPKDSP